MKKAKMIFQETIVKSHWHYVNTQYTLRLHMIRWQIYNALQFAQTHWHTGSHRQFVYLPTNIQMNGFFCFIFAVFISLLFHFVLKNHRIEA